MSELKKTLNIYQGTGILISTLLGSGIFIVPAIVATIAGGNSLIAWIFMIVLILPVAFTFSALGVLYPHAGGTAFFVKKAFGDKFENFISWLYLSVIFIGPPVVVITGASYLGAIFNATPSQVFLVSLSMLLVMFLINLFGLKFSGNIHTIISIAIVSLLVALIFLGYKGSSLGGMNKEILFSQSSFLQIGKAMSIIFWCFVGIEAIAHLAAEFKNVKKDFPRAVFISVIGVGILYFLISLIVLQQNAYGTEMINNHSLVYLINKLIGNYGKYLVGIMGFLTCFAAVNLYLLSSSRLMYSMSKNRILFNFLSKTTVNSVPFIALLVTFSMVTCTVILKFLFDINLTKLISYANGVFVLIYLAAAVSGIKLLKGKNKFFSVLAATFCLVTMFCIGRMVIYGIFILLFSLLWERFNNQQ